MKVLRCHTLPIYPTRVQRRALEGILESQRQLYNAALDERIGAYRATANARHEMVWRDDAESEAGGYYVRRHLAAVGKPLVSVDKYSQSRELTKVIAANPVYGAVQRRIHCGTLGKLDKAFKAFFSRARSGAGGSSGFPRFKGRDFFDGFQFDAPLQVTVLGSRIRFKGLTGGLRISKDQLANLPPLVASGKGDGNWKGIGFRRDGDRWSVWLQVEHEITVTRAGKGLGSVGVDWGTSSLYVLSNGIAYPALTASADKTEVIAAAQRSVSAKRKGSKGRRKARHHLQAVQRRVANRRKNYLNKATANLAKHYAHLAVEKIAVRTMTKKKKAAEINVPVFVQTGRNQRALDSAPAMFRMQLAYKAEREGTSYAEVDPAYTTQICSCCGAMVPKELVNMDHACSSCGLTLSRKENAARVIHLRGGRVPRIDGPPSTGSTSGGCEPSADGSRSGYPDFHLPRIAESKRRRSG